MDDLSQRETVTAFPVDTCLHELFEAQVARMPQAIAVVCGEQRVTYEELNAWANEVARRLREVGVGPDALVAVCLERGVPMVVALLAVGKAGGAYVPLDPSYPLERLRFMLTDCSPVALLADGGWGAGILPEDELRVVVVEVGEPPQFTEAAHASADMPKNEAFPFSANDVQGPRDGTVLIGTFHGTTSL